MMVAPFSEPQVRKERKRQIRDDKQLTKVEDVTRLRSYAEAGFLIGNLVFSLEDNLHLIVGCSRC